MTSPTRKRVYDLYLGNTQFVNNWDLVDCSAPQVVGGFLMTEAEGAAVRPGESRKALWERRIAIVSTQHFIRHGEFGETRAIGELLLGEPRRDLIHRAVGLDAPEVGVKIGRFSKQFLPALAQRSCPARCCVRHRAVHARPAACSTSGEETFQHREPPMAFDESLAAQHPGRPRPHKERRGEEDVRLRLFLPQREHTGRSLEGRPHRPPRPRRGEAAFREPHVRAFDITGRPMRNWVAVEPEGVEDDDQLREWVERATKFVRTLPKKTT